MQKTDLFPAVSAAIPSLAARGPHAAGTLEGNGPEVLTSGKDVCLARKNEKLKDAAVYREWTQKEQSHPSDGASRRRQPEDDG